MESFRRVFLSSAVEGKGAVNEQVKSWSLLHMAQLSYSLSLVHHHTTKPIEFRCLALLID
jgi:hypothetical protein